MGRELACASELDLILGTVALALDAHGLCVVQQAVQKGRREDGVVVEDAGPLLVDAICGEKGGAVLVAVADDLEQAVGTKLVDGQVAQFVDAQHLGFDVVVQRALDAAAGLRSNVGIHQPSFTEIEVAPGLCPTVTGAVDSCAR